MVKPTKRTITARLRRAYGPPRRCDCEAYWAARRAAAARAGMEERRGCGGNHSAALTYALRPTWDGPIYWPGPYALEPRAYLQACRRCAVSCLAPDWRERSRA